MVPHFHYTLIGVVFNTLEFSIVHFNFAKLHVDLLSVKHSNVSQVCLIHTAFRGVQLDHKLTGKVNTVFVRVICALFFCFGH